MSLLLNMLSSLVITFLPRSKRLLISWLQSPSAVILEPQKIKSDSLSTVSPSICHEVMGPDVMILVFWMLSFFMMMESFWRSSFCPHKNRPDFYSFSGFSNIWWQWSWPRPHEPSLLLMDKPHSPLIWQKYPKALTSKRKDSLGNPLVNMHSIVISRRSPISTFSDKVLLSLGSQETHRAPGKLLIVHSGAMKRGWILQKAAIWSSVGSC